MMHALMIVAVLVLGSFAIGTIWNVRKGSALMRWMQGGLPLLGERTTVRWLGSTAVEMVIQHAAAPFARIVVILFLEPRDMPWMWAAARVRGRRDTIIIRGWLRNSPSTDFEALDPASWSGRDALRHLSSTEWSAREPVSPGGLRTYYQRPTAISQADDLVDRASRAGLSVRRLSVRRTEPHFQLHISAPAHEFPASRLFQEVLALGTAARN